MSAIGDELEAIVTELEARGVPATTDPTDVWTLAAQADTAVALVGVPESVGLVGLPGRVRLEVPVTLAARGPDVDGYGRVLAALPSVLWALRAQEPAMPQRHTRGDASMPAYQITCLRDVEE